MANTITISNATANMFVERIAIIGADAVRLAAGEAQGRQVLVADLVTKDEARQMRVAVPVKYSGEISPFTVQVADLCQIANAILNFDKEADLKIKVSDGGVSVSLSAGKVSMDVPVVAEGKVIEAVGSEALFTAQLDRKALLSVIKHNRFFDPENEKTMSIGFTINDESLVVSCTNMVLFVRQAMSVAGCKHGSIWEKAEKEDGVSFAIPGLLAQVIERSLASSTQEKVVVTVDTKYMHVMYDGGCLASVRLAAVAGSAAAVAKIIAAKGDCVFAVDKAKLESALKIIATKLSLSKGVGEDVPVLLSGSKDGLLLSVCENKVLVACGEGSADGAEIYVAPDLLRDAISVSDSGNVRIAIIKNGEKSFITLGNGTVADGIKKDAAGVVAAPVSSETGEKEQSRFASGKSKKEAKKAEITETSEQISA